MSGIHASRVRASGRTNVGMQQGEFVEHVHGQRYDVFFMQKTRFGVRTQRRNLRRAVDEHVVSSGDVKINKARRWQASLFHERGRGRNYHSRSLLNAEIPT